MSEGAGDPFEAVPDLTTAQALLRLRLLAEEAARRAADTSPAGQHQALISLDGACEFAPYLAAHRVNIEITPKTRFADLYSQIAAATSWKSASWMTVKQMHLARNNAQHHAMPPNPGEMPGWRDASIAFIDAICVEMFDTKLADIRLANAVRDLTLRDMLRVSEEQLPQSSVASMGLVFRAFELALYGWRKQLGHPVVPLFQHGRQLPAPTSTLMVGIDEVQLFASDPSEYVWLRRAWQEMESASWVPGIEDVRRALSFVTTWIVRWELFTLGYPDAEWAAHRDAIEPPKSSIRQEIHVRWAHTVVQPEAPGRPPMHMIHFQLVNVPGRGRQPWEAILLDALVGAARDLKAPQFRSPSWSMFGILTVLAELDSDPSLAADVVERALPRAVKRFDAATAESEAREQARQELELELQRLVQKNTDPSLGLIESVLVVPDQWLGTSDWMALIGTPSTGPELLEMNSLMHSFRSQHLSSERSALPEVHMRVANEIRFIIGELTDEIKESVVAAIKNAEEHVAHARGVRAKQAETAQVFAAGIGERFPAWSQPPSESDLA